MRLKINIRQTKPDQLIPLNYQFSLSSFIYRTIERSDNNYSKWLHDSGLMSGSKSFKYFTFSKLYIPKTEITELYGKKYLKIMCGSMDLIVSMLSNRTVENFIIGMFENQRLKIYDSNVESEFIVNTVEMIPEPDFKNEMMFKTISPVVISRNTVYNEKLSQKYLDPADEEYAEYFRKNLEEKYLVLISGEKSDTPVINIMKKENESIVHSFETSGQAKSKLITIKEGTPEETKVRGYFFTFRIKAEPEIIRLGYEAGFGKHCSLGFGCVEVQKNNIH